MVAFKKTSTIIIVYFPISKEREKKYYISKNYYIAMEH